jgi:type IV secretory pathway TraG/TraD family ATPase VirD4
MIHNLLLRLSEGLPLSPPLVVGAGTALIVVLTLGLYSRSRGTILFCVAIGLVGTGLVVGLVAVQAPGEPLLWGQVEEAAGQVIGPPAFRRLEQITAVTFALALATLFLVYNLAFQEKPGERPRRMLEQDTAQSRALGSAHLCEPHTFRRWSKHDPSGWTLQGRFWGAKGQRLGDRFCRSGRFCLSGEDIARGVAVFGAQGSGKTQSVILPAIADRMRDGHSLIVTDVQGELQSHVQRFAAVTGHTIVIHNPSQPQSSCHINLCDWIDNVADAKATASVLLSDTHTQGDNQFWNKSAANLLAACTLHYASFGEVLDARQDIYKMATHLKSSRVPGVADLSSDFVNSMQSRDPKLGLNIMATAFSVGLAPWADPAVRQISNHSGAPLKAAEQDLDLAAQLAKSPTVLILRCLRRHTEAYGAYLGVILRVLTARLDDIGEAAGGPLPLPVGLILEEFPALGRLDSLVRDINLVRKRRISILTAAQSLAQFDHVYPARGEADQLMAGLATKIVFGGCDQRTAEFFSRMSGQQTLALSSLSRSAERSGQKAHSVGTASLRGRALLLPDDIIRPERGHATVFAAYGEGGRAEQVIFHARLTPFFRRKDWKLKKVQPKAPLAVPQAIREQQPDQPATTPEQEPVRSELEPELDIAEMW